MDAFLRCHWPKRYLSTTINAARQHSTAPGCCVYKAFKEDKKTVNDGVEEAARVCAALVGATVKEGIVGRR